MNENIKNWLLENNNPAIKYRTLTEILDEDPQEHKDTYNEIWEQKSISNMMKKQDENGLWESEKKYYGNFVSLRYLTAFAEHGIQKDERIDRFVDWTVKNLQTNEKAGGLPGCASPLVLRALVMLGYHDREDVLELIKKFASSQFFDGGYMCKRLLDRKPERKSCYKAAIDGLLLFAESKRKNILLPESEKLLDYFKNRNVFYSSDKTKKFDEGRFGWRFIDNFFPVEPMRMGLPLIISALSISGAGNDPSMSESWEMLEQKKNENGKFHLDGTLTKQPCSFGKVGKENKWITFYAMLAEKHRVN